MRITWDETKRRTNLTKHGFDFADLSMEFFSSSKIYAAKGERFKAVGEWNGLIIVAVVFRPLGSEAISVISMRPASTKERRVS